MKVLAEFLEVNQTVKFSDVYGTFTMKINKLESFRQKEVYVTGTVLTSSSIHYGTPVGESKSKSFRRNTKVNIIN